MKPLIYYYCLDLSPKQENFVETSLCKFEKVMKHPPLEVDCEIAVLLSNIQKKIAKDLSHHSFRDCVNQMSCTLGEEATKDRPIPQLLICCSQNHSLARKCRAESPTSVWGSSIGRIALAYNPDDHCTMWHELLHTLGAEDCYALPNRGPTCEHPQCIMQRETHTPVVNDCLPLCNKNVNFIRERFAKIKFTT